MRLSNYLRIQEVFYSKCLTESIGTDAVILRGVHVGNGAVIGANAVVTKDVPDFAIVAGVPAKILRYRFDEKKRKEILESKWWKKDKGGRRNNKEIGEAMIASFVLNFYLNNKIFDIADEKINRDNYAYFYFKLKETFKHNGIDLSTCDINKPEESDIVIYNGLGQKFVDYGYEKSYLLATESPHVDKKAFNKKYHKYFKKIFTWDDRLVDNKKYFKVNYAFEIPKEIPKKFYGKKLCCCIAGNKYSKHPDELYSKRIEIIRWFEKYHLEDFDLYGMGWNEYNFGKTLVGKVLNKFKMLRKFFAPNFPSYQGAIKSKFEIMKNYKFSICYENIKDQPGYITEKIFDSFFAGCIPIYWGASNITDYIPENCFIDKRKFNSYEELYEYMVSMRENEYMEYLDNIEKFLNSEKANPFRAETFANTIVNEILKDLNGNN